MAVAGKGGGVYLGATKVSEVADWSIDAGADTIDTTSMDSNGWKEFLAGLKDWSGSLNANWNVKLDTLGQKALWTAYLNGTILAAKLNIDGTGPNLTGNIIINSWGTQSAVADKVSLAVGFQGTAALNYADA